MIMRPIFDLDTILAYLTGETESSEEIPVIVIKRMEQLGIFLLDGSGSMDDIGEFNISLAENVGRVFKDFVSTFKTSSIKEEFQIAVINFDYEAVVRVPRMPLAEFDDFADYNPRDKSKENPHANISAGLKKAKEIIGDFFAQPNPNEFQRIVNIVILSNGMCQCPEDTLKIARDLDDNPNITINCGVFITKESEKDGENSSQTLLEDLVSNNGMCRLIKNSCDLRMFFDSDMESVRRVS